MWIKNSEQTSSYMNYQPEQIMEILVKDRYKMILDNFRMP